MTSIGIALAYKRRILIYIVMHALTRSLTYIFMSIKQMKQN